MAETGLNQNSFRDYDPLVGKYVESDPIGFAGGSYSPYAYVGGNPISKFDSRGLQEAESDVLPGYRPPNNAKEAAGWFDQEYELQCTSWFGPTPGQCTASDYRTPFDFIPAATSVKTLPKGVTYVDMAWHKVNKTWDSNDVISAANSAADAAKDGPSIWVSRCLSENVTR